MKHIVVLVIIVLFFSCQKQQENELFIASASSLRNVLEELTAEFSKQTNIKANFITASSGKLSAQIEAGAPYDVFLSANAKYPKYLQLKLELGGELFDFAYGKVVFLISKDRKEVNITSFLKNNEIKKIVIPNMEVAPYGIAANEILKNVRIYDKVVGKLVFAENVSQANQFLKSKTVDAGFTSLSSVKVNSFQKEYNIVSLSDTLYAPIKNTLLIVSKNKQKQQKAQKFKAFLQTEKAIYILKKYGYTIPR